MYGKGSSRGAHVTLLYVTAADCTCSLHRFFDREASLSSIGGIVVERLPSLYATSSADAAMDLWKGTWKRF